MEPEIKTPPSYSIKYPIRVGTSWSDTVTSSSKPKISVPVKNTIKSIDEVVTVPAGTFKECLKIKGIGSVQKRLDGNSTVSIDIEAYAWYTPDVGLIKMILKEKKTRSGGLVLTPPESRKIAMQFEIFK